MFCFNLDLGHLQMYILFFYVMYNVFFCAGLIQKTRKDQVWWRFCHHRQHHLAQDGPRLFQDLFRSSHRTRTSQFVHFAPESLSLPLQNQSVQLAMPSSTKGKQGQFKYGIFTYSKQLILFQLCKEVEMGFPRSIQM